MSEKAVLLDATREGVAVVTLNRPAVHNAVDEDLLDDLHDIVEELKGADGVRAVILEAAGENFSSGFDVEWLRFVADYTHDDNVEVARDIQSVLAAWRMLPQLTVALVQGAAAGFAVGLIAASDVAIAMADALFSIPDARLGFCPAAVVPSLLQSFGPRTTRRLVVLGERLTAEQALSLGLVHDVVAERQGLADASEALISTGLENSPGAIAATKHLLAHIEDAAGGARLTNEIARRYAESLASDDGREGFAALLAGRKPRWSV